MPVPERLGALPSRQPDSEDDLFLHGTVCVTVQVALQWRRSSQGDIVMRGFVGGKEIEVVFRGQRRNGALQLAQRLHESVTKPKAGQPSSGDRAELRPTLVIDGVWRARLMAEQQGIPVRRFQLFAARWRYHGPHGMVYVDGFVPHG